MGTELFIEACTRNKNGKVTNQIPRRESHSYVQGWNWMLCAQFLGASNPSPILGPVQDIGGTNRNLRTCGIPFRANGGIGSPDPGIRIGTSNAAVAIGQYALQAPIGQGTGSGQMEHQGHTYNFVGVVGNECSFTVQRVFVNNSGVPINVQEAGIYMTAFRVGAIGVTMCAARDLITQNVPDGGSVTITYTIRIVA